MKQRMFIDICLGHRRKKKFQSQQLIGDSGKKYSMTPPTRRKCVDLFSFGFGHILSNQVRNAWRIFPYMK